MLEFISLTNSFNVQRTIQIASVEGGYVHVSRIKVGVKIWYLNKVNHDMLPMNHDRISSFNAKEKVYNPKLKLLFGLLQLTLDVMVIIVRSCCHCVLYC